MIRVSNEVVKRINDEDINSLVSETSFSNEVCVRIELNSSSLTGSNGNAVCALNNLSDSQVQAIAYETYENGGKHLFKDYKLAYPFNDKELFIYGQIVISYNQPILILVSTTVQPLNATISTIKSQYSMIAIIIILVTLLLSFLLSKMIIVPIKYFRDGAKKLPLGKYVSDLSKIKSLELNELNESLVSANDEINKADKTRKDLLSNVSHDLRTPLTMIVGYGEMIRDFKEENNDENINVIINEAKRLSCLVDDLLDVSHIESNQLVLHKEDVSLNELLRTVFQQYDKYCSTIDVKLSLELDDDCIVNVDSKRISQVLYNFINNAINYNDSSQKKIRIVSKKIDNRYKISVIDNGHGIKEEDIDRIWQRYYKVDKEHVRFHLGSGIGLSIARQLLELHGIEYGVESEYGEYSEFYFLLKPAESQED